MKHLIVQDLPPYFYKYRSLASEAQHKIARQIIVEHALYWNAPAQFNDPFDCAPVPIVATSKIRRDSDIRKLAKKLRPGSTRNERRQLRISKNMGPKVLEAHMRKDLARHMQSVAVCSLSELGDNVLMWSHYADSHRGICLRFQPLHRLPGDQPELKDAYFELAYPVTYSETRPRLRVPIADPDEALEKTLLTKADYWSYEREWRLVEPRFPAGIRHFPVRSLDAVILGARISTENEALVREWVGQRVEPLKILKASFDENLFRLNIG